MSLFRFAKDLLSGELSEGDVARAIGRAISSIDKEEAATAVGTIAAMMGTAAVGRAIGRSSAPVVGFPPIPTIEEEPREGERKPQQKQREQELMERRLSREEERQETRDTTRAANIPPPAPGLYAYLEGKQQGPYDLTQFSRLVEYGIADANTLVWRTGMEQWAAAKSLADLRPALGLPEQPAQSFVPPPLPE